MRPQARRSPRSTARRATTTLPSRSAPTGTSWRSVASAGSYASGTSAPGSSSTSSTRAATERSPSSSARTAGLSRSPASSPSRLSGTSRPGPSSARSSRPGDAGRWSICRPTDARCCRCTAAGRGLSGTSIRSRGRGARARSPTARSPTRSGRNSCPGGPTSRPARAESGSEADRPGEARQRGRRREAAGT